MRTDADVAGDGSLLTREGRAPFCPILFHLCYGGFSQASVNGTARLFYYQGMAAAGLSRAAPRIEFLCLLGGTRSRQPLSCYPLSDRPLCNRNQEVSWGSQPYQEE